MCFKPPHPAPSSFMDQLDTSKNLPKLAEI